MKHGLMALLAFSLCLFESAHAQQQWINSSHSFYSNEDGRYFALTLVAILAGVFVVFSVAAFITHNYGAPENCRRRNNGATSNHQSRISLQTRKRNEPVRSAEQN